MYSFHLFLTSSGSVSNLPLSSVMTIFPFLALLFPVNFLTLAYTRSVLPLLSSSSSSLHCSSHHIALALSFSLRSSLFSCLYFLFPYSVFLLFHFLLSFIFSNIPLVIHGFLARLPFL